MRTTIAAVAIALALGGCSGANSASGGSSQDGAAPGAAAAGRHRMAAALATLGLSDDQKAKIRGFMSDARKQSANADPATRRANFKAAQAKIDTILTPEQLTKWHALLAQMRSERSQGASPQS